MTQPSSAPPGWYDVPGGVRWWSGSAWEGEVHPAPSPQVAQAQVSYVPVPTNHTFHLLMTLLTCGLWGVLVWLPMTVINQLRKNKTVTRPY